MTQSPRGGQTAPPAGDLGSRSGSSTAVDGLPDHRNGAHAVADAPTGSMPQLSSSRTVAEAPREQARASRNRGPRRARLQLRHIDPWTVLKFSCVLSVALFFVWMIVVGVLFGILDAAGIIGKINQAVTTIEGGDTTAPVTAGVVFGAAAIIGVIDMVLFIALSTIGSLVYNLCADLVGGIEVTLSER